MKRQFKLLWTFAFLFVWCFLVATASADTITGNQLLVKVADDTVAYDLDEVKTEVENGTTKVCICRCLCFRALQTLATRFEDGVIPRDDIKIYTGWTTDGPEELFVEVMGWAEDNLALFSGATNAVYLTIEDAFFYFVQKSTGKAWKVVASESLYPTGFFSYRTAVKDGSASEEEINFFKKALRPQAVSNMASLPMIDKFFVEAVSYLSEDGVLHIPAALAPWGMAYEAEFEDTGEGSFQLIKSVSNH